MNQKNYTFADAIKRVIKNHLTTLIAVICGIVFTVIMSIYSLKKTSNSGEEKKLSTINNLISINEDFNAQMVNQLTSLRLLLQNHGPEHFEGGSLYFGTYKVNGNYKVVDQINDNYNGTVATVFQIIPVKDLPPGDVGYIKKDNIYYVAQRVTTNVQNNGVRAVGTYLGVPVFERSVKEGKTYIGWADILGKEYVTGYTPIHVPGAPISIERDSKNQPIGGVYFVGKFFDGYIKQVQRIIESIDKDYGNFILFNDNKKIKKQIAIASNTSEKLETIDFSSLKADYNEKIKGTGLTLAISGNSEKTLALVTLPVGAGILSLILMVYMFLSNKQRYREKNRAILDQIISEVNLAPVLIVNAQGRIANINKPFEQVFGIAAESIQGKDLTELFHGDAGVMLLDSLSKDQIVELEKISIVVNNKPLPLKIRSKPYKTIDGRITGAIISMRDLSSFELLRSQQQKTEEEKVKLGMLYADIKEAFETIKLSLSEMNHAIEKINNDVRDSNENQMHSDNLRSSLLKNVGNAHGDVNKQFDASKEHLQDVSAEVEINLQTTIEKINKMQKVLADAGSRTTMLEEISEQINLLSLNSAIEAARLGEKGAGFNVISDEINKLGDNTHKGLIDLQKMIRDIVEDTKDVHTHASNTNTIFKRLQNSVEALNQLHGNVESIIGTIDSNSRDLDTISNTVSEAYQQIAAAIEQVNASIENLNAITEDRMNKIKLAEEEIEKDLNSAR